jgi:hypothetical protein
MLLEVSAVQKERQDAPGAEGATGCPPHASAHHGAPSLSHR